MSNTSFQTCSYLCYFRVGYTWSHLTDNSHILRINIFRPGSYICECGLKDNLKNGSRMTVAKTTKILLFRNLTELTSHFINDFLLTCYLLNSLFLSLSLPLSLASRSLEDKSQRKNFFLFSSAL